jgi:hypothetical protein
VSRTVHIMHKFKSILFSWPNAVILKCDWKSHFGSETFFNEMLH